jgi:ketosteroid isomerase-like protein
MKGKSIWVFLIVFPGISMIACKAPAPTGLTDQDRAAILKLSEEGLKLFNAPERDFEAAVKFLYTEDAITLPANQPAVQGRANQIAWYNAFPPFELKENILELDGRGDLAYTRGTYSLKVKMPGVSEPVLDAGKGMEIWKKQKDGSWKVSCDIVNSDLPINVQTPAQTETGGFEKELIKLENEWADAWVKSDVAFFDRIMADDYMWTAPEGYVNSKADILALAKSGVITSRVLADMKVRVYGDAAVVFGRDTTKETYKGEYVSSHRWTHTWVKRAGRWQCVAAHSSLIAQK